MTIDWGNAIINVFKTDMVQIQSVPTEIWQLDIPTFKETLGDLLDDEAGMSYPDIFSHNPQVVVGGAVLAKVVEILDPYTITFEDGQYAVNLVGANSNIGDRVNVNQVSIRSANSAGLQDLTSLQAASFGDGAIALDQVNGVAGTVFPIGTKGTPVNNWADARAIAEQQNMSKILVLGNASCGAGDDISNLTIMGTNPLTSSLTVAAAADTQNVYIKELYFIGSLDGGTILRDCVIGAVQYFDGYMENCALTSNTVEINGSAVLLNCVAGATNIDHPHLDLTNATSVTVRGFDGDLEINNMVTPGLRVHISLTGHLEVGVNCTEGTIELHGDADIDNLGGGNLVIEDATTGTPETIASTVWSNPTRELTTTTGLTPAQETKLDTVLSYTGDMLSGMKGGWQKVDDGTIIFYKEDGSELARLYQKDQAGNTKFNGGWALLPT